jgi:hypothetical protein
MKFVIILTLFYIISKKFVKTEDNYFIKIGDKTFPFELKNTKTANEINSKLPFTIKMTNLNGNEVYYNFDERFSTDSKSIGKINTGDIYLYQSNCLVLFYKSFTTSYSYSEIGKLTNTDGLADVIGSGSITIKWCKNSCNDDDNDSDIENVDDFSNNSLNLVKYCFSIFKVILFLIIF